MGGWFVHCRLGMKDCELIMVVLRGGLSRSRFACSIGCSASFIVGETAVHAGPDRVCRAM